ncbi:MAG: 16S rRNA (uracil(1498)-N(3))-methyltransferase [Kiritimatiellae bacterium]|nr:16S rRNA (uracil(1498)-N(3))-methyltransferase [Kiritimatiellia bacterium]
MHRCLIPTASILEETCALDRESARHLQTVLRVQPGDVVQLFDGAGRARLAKVETASRNGITFTAAEPLFTAPRPATRVTLFACVSKGKRMDWTIEKAVELGISRIVPVLSAHTVVKIPPEEREAKTERWQRIAEEAMRQSCSFWCPEILPPVKFGESLELVAQSQPVFVGALTPDAEPFRTALNRYPKAPENAGWYVGPEGDFSPEELDALRQAGTVPVSLGPTVLRAETACLYGLCVLNCAFCR